MLGILVLQHAEVGGVCVRRLPQRSWRRSSQHRWRVCRHVLHRYSCCLLDEHQADTFHVPPSTLCSCTLLLIHSYIHIHSYIRAFMHSCIHTFMHSHIHSARSCVIVQHRHRERAVPAHRWSQPHLKRAQERQSRTGFVSTFDGLCRRSWTTLSLTT